MPSPPAVSHLPPSSPGKSAAPCKFGVSDVKARAPSAGYVTCRRRARVLALGQSRALSRSDPLRQLRSSFRLTATGIALLACAPETNVKPRVFELDVQPDPVAGSSRIVIRFAMEGEAP